jgi:hypothetical protein
MQSIFWSKNRKETTWKDLSIDGRTIFELVLKDRVGACELDSSGSE